MDTSQYIDMVLKGALDENNPQQIKLLDEVLAIIDYTIKVLKKQEEELNA